MTRKQIKKLVNELVQLELIHQDPSSSKKDKLQAEKRIMELSSLCFSESHGLEIMVEIDSQVQEKLNKLKEN